MYDILLLEEILHLRGHTGQYAGPRHPLFNDVFSSPVRWCRISVIQLLCCVNTFSLPMLSREHEGQDSKCFFVQDQPYY